MPCSVGASGHRSVADHRVATLQLSEGAFGKVLQLPHEERAEFLVSLPRCETEHRDITSNDKADPSEEPPKTTANTERSVALRMIQPPRQNVLEGGSTASADMIEKLLEKSLSRLAHPVLFLPAWFSGNLFIKGFEVVREEELELHLKEMIQNLGGDEERIRKHVCSDSAKSLARFVGGRARDLVKISVTAETEGRGAQVPRLAQVVPEEAGLLPSGGKKVESALLLHACAAAREKPKKLERLQQLPTLSSFQLTTHHPPLPGKVNLDPSSSQSDCKEGRNFVVEKSSRYSSANVLAWGRPEFDSLSEILGD